MATKAPDFTNVIGSDAMQEYLDAQKNARDKFEERNNNRLFDPTMLAMAQGFLAPTKTGSFGESLGNVAAAVGPAQAAEEKRTMDMAKMRLEMAQQGIQTDIQTKQAQMRQNLINEDLGADSPYAKPRVAPQVAPQPAPQLAPTAATAGALPSQAPAMPAPPAQAPAQAPLSMAQPAPPALPTPQAPAPAPAPAPMALKGPVGTQLFPAQPEGFTAQEKLDYKRGIAAGKDPYEIRKDIMENRRKNIQVNQAGTSGVNLLTGEKFGFDPTPTKTFIHGYGSVEIPATYATMLGNAQDAEEYAKIAKMIMLGPQPTAPAPSTPNATPTGKAPAGAPLQRPTTAQAEADAAALKAEKEADAKARSKRTELAIDKLEPAMEVRAVAETAKNLVNQEGGNLVVGIFEKPTVSSILGKMVDEGKFTPVGFREAMVAANVAFTVDQKPDETSQQYTDRKQAILDRYYQMGTQVARAKFEASTLAKGQGAFSDGERRMFADTTISTKMSVSSMNKTADMLIARANFAESVGEKLLGKEISFDKFRITPEYKSMLKAYEARLQSIWSGNTRAPSRSGRPDLNAAGANLDRQVQ
tara:strand:+ start:1104 stop:2858 length:1755 start_codon:yes stop_codon:yes gene_type:complete